MCEQPLSPTNASTTKSLINKNLVFPACINSSTAYNNKRVINGTVSRINVSSLAGGVNDKNAWKSSWNSITFID